MVVGHLVPSLGRTRGVARKLREGKREADRTNRSNQQPRQWAATNVTPIAARISRQPAAPSSSALPYRRFMSRRDWKHVQSPGLQAWSAPEEYDWLQAMQTASDALMW